MFLRPVQPPNSLNYMSSKKSTNSFKSNKPPLKKTTSATQKKFKPKNRKGGAQNVPKETVLLEVQLQKTMRKNADEKLQSNEEHTKNLLQTKQMLSDILKEYDHISKDKIILTAEIKNMKKYLSEIRLKLDQSLLILNKNTTLFAMKKGLTMGKYVLGNKKSSSIKAIKGKRSKKSKKKSDLIEPILKSILSNSD